VALTKLPTSQVRRVRVVRGLGAPAREGPERG